MLERVLRIRLVDIVFGAGLHFVNVCGIRNGWFESGDIVADVGNVVVGE